MKKYKAAFFDRDGTLIKDVSYLSSEEQIELIDTSITFCKALFDAGYKIFVVTNQSGIARGFFTEETLNRINLKLQTILESFEIKIEKFYYCPHHPIAAKELVYKKDCNCRKPKPQMLLDAIAEFDIDPNNSLMFGDKDIDIVAGMAAGVQSFYIQQIIDNKILTIKDFQKYLQKLERKCCE